MPLEIYKRALVDLDCLDACASSDWAKAAISLASPYFSKVMTTFESADLRTKVELRSTLLRYLSRASARATPFGIFAAVGLARVEGGGEPLALQAFENWSARIVLDYDWLKSLRTNAKAVVWNNEALLRGRRYFLRQGARSEAHGDPSLPTSVNANRLVLHVADLALTPLSIEFLCESMASTFDIDSKKAEALVTALVDAGFLLQHVDAHMSDVDPRKFLQVEDTTFKRAHEVLSCLQKAARTSASSLTVSGIDRVREELALVSGSRVESLSVDLIAETTGSLPRRVLRDLEKLSDIMWRCSTKVDLTDYRERFQRRYDTFDVTVPLDELFDQNYGIGLPAPPEGARSTSLPSDFALLVDWACANRNREVDVSQFALETIFGPRPAEEELPPSFELAVQFMAPAINDIEDGDHTIALLPLIGTKLARASRMRFHENLNVELSTSGNDSALTVDLSFVPSVERGWNLVKRPPSTEHEVAFGPIAPSPSCRRLHLADLGATVRDNRFQLCFLADGAPVSIRNPNVVNMQMAPPAARALWMLSLDGSREIGEFKWESHVARFFIPRVRFHRFILSKARWRFPKALLLRSLESTISDWLQSYDVPQFVTVGTADRLLILDTQSRFFRDELREEARRETGDHLVISESLLDDAPYLLSGRVSEFVFSFARAEHRKPESSAPLHFPRPARVRFVPGSEWVYVRAYGPSSGNAYLRGEFARELLPKVSCLSDKWFFVRYDSPSPHLRIRFRASAPGHLKDLVHAITTHYTALTDRGTVDRFEFCTYEPEIERYTFPPLAMPSVETLFHFSSSSAIDDFAEHESSLESVLRAAIFSFTELLDAINIPRTVNPLIFGPRTKLDSRARKLVREIVTDLLPNEKRYASKRSVLLADIKLHLAGSLFDVQTYWPFVGSLLHMHLNRYGITASSEVYAVAIFRAVRQSLAQRIAIV